MTSVNEPPKIPPAPPGLARGGRRKWREAHEKYVFTPAETAILERICRQIDRLERLDGEISASPVVVDGSRGQPVPSPLLAEIRLQELALGKLVKLLALPDEPSRTPARVPKRKGKLATVHGLTQRSS